MQGYLSYYLFWLLAPMALSYLSSHPVVLLAVPLAWLARRWLPDPVLWLAHFSRMRSLEAHIAANPHNLTARLRLAQLCLRLRRPKRAIQVLEPALEREKDSAEFLASLGQAYAAVGDDARALEHFASALRIDPRHQYGDVHLGSARSLARLGKPQEALAALEQLLRINSSSVEGLYLSAALKRSIGDRQGARAAAREAVATYRQLPGFQRGKQFGWMLRARGLALIA